MKHTPFLLTLLAVLLLTPLTALRAIDSQTKSAPPDGAKTVMASSWNQSAASNFPGLCQKDGALFKNGQPYRGVGVNYFDVLTRRLHSPTNQTSLDGLRKLGRMRIPFVRFAAAFDDQDWKLFFDDRAAYFRQFDEVARTAESAEVGLIPSFFWHFMEFPDLAGEPRDQWGNPDSKTMKMMREYVGAVVDRYKDSPAIWTWEFGNEPNLAADLPNATVFRKHGGTERDDLKSADFVVMLREFAAEVRRHDDHRPVFTGNSHPRASSWHNSAEKSWKPASRQQTLEILRRDNPAPLDTIGIHLYADKPIKNEVAAWSDSSSNYLSTVKSLAQEMKRPVFIGEFGIASKGDEAAERAKFEQLLTDIGDAGVDLAAVWVFDLKTQDKNWNITSDNSRAYMLKLVAEANHRWNKAFAFRQPSSTD